jgi:4-hydroxybenzoate polyprenyltransferase
VAPALARWIGVALLIAGVGFGWLSGAMVEPPASPLHGGLIACLLAACVWAYDARLKQTWLGPPTMGGCRFLNVLLGMSAAAGAWQQMHWIVAGGIGVYIVGVTWFARTEAVESSRAQLALSTAVILAGMALLWAFPSWWEEGIDRVSYPRFALIAPERWSLFWAVLAALVGWRCVMVVVEPTPIDVQRAVKHCILSLIVLDAAACFAVRGWQHATVILLLLVPTMFLGRWIYST